MPFAPRQPVIATRGNDRTGDDRTDLNGGARPGGRTLVAIFAALLVAAVGVTEAAGHAAEHPGDHSGDVPTARPVARPMERPESPVPATLRPERLVVESLGISLHPPREAGVALEPVENNEMHLVIVEPSDPPRWRIRIRPLESRLATPAARMIVQDHLNRLEALGRPYTVLANDPVRYADVDGHLLVVLEPEADGRESVNGWVILPRGGLQFLVVTLNTDRIGLASARPLLEASLSTLRILDETAMIDERRERLERGSSVIRQITRDRLKSLDGHDQWHRLYQPAQPGRDEQDLGSVRIRATIAPRGSVHHDRAADRYSTAEREEGLLVTVTARAFLNDDGSQRIDMEHRYWMSWDRSLESWSSRNITFERGRQRASSQTGIREPVRSGHPSSVLTVVNDTDMRSAGGAPLTWTIPNSAYLCQPEVLLLGELLGGMNDVPAEMAFFYFDTRRNRLPQRVDQWRVLDDATGSRQDRPRYELLTTPALDEPVVRQLHDAKGLRLRRIEADGSVAERIDPRTLRDLWRRKGLPIS